MSDIANIRETTKALFLAVPIEPRMGMILCHPFATSTLVPMRKNNEMSFGDLTNKEDYEAWKKSIFDIIDKSSTDKIFALINKPYRLCWLKYTKDFMSKTEFSKYLAEAWVLSENPNDDVNVKIPELIKWFKSADKKSLMSEDDYKVWQELPEEFTVYRGVANGHNPEGLSWTTHLETAEWFRDRFKGTESDRYILKATVKKSECFCYFNTRNEDEVVVNSRAIKDKIEKL